LLCAVDSDGPVVPVQRDAFVERVHQLASDPSVQVESLDGQTAVLRPAGANRRIVIARYRPESEAALLERVGKLMRSMGPLRLEVLMVGGPERLRALLKRTRPLFTTSRQYLYHQADDGSLWSDAQGPSFARLSTAAPPVDEAALVALQEKRLRGHQVVTAERAELSTFIDRQRSARPVLTWVVLGIIGVVFAMELAFGGAEAPPTLLRMGAFYRPKVEQGEIWRFASCTFLHGSVLHALMNAYVLFVLGSFVEKIIGRWRFALLYAAAAFGGSVASYLRLEHEFSVGASGALWGCLGAHAVLAFRPGGLLPKAMIPGARNAAVINLFLNVMISFWPHVDWAAHAGGGLVGAAVMHLVLRHGLPPLGDMDEAATPPVDRRPRVIAPIALVLSGLLLGGLVVALVRGRAWELTRPPRLESTTISELGADVAIPTLLDRRPSEPIADDGVVVVFGEQLLDPAVVIIARVPLAALAGDELSAFRAQLRDELGEVPKDGKLLERPTDATIGGRPAVRARYALGSGGAYEVEVVFVLFDRAMYKVEAGRVSTYDDWRDVGSRVAASIRPHAP
jgi:membrane associated rhomboid family serine protease